MVISPGRKVVPDRVRVDLEPYHPRGVITDGELCRCECIKIRREATDLIRSKRPCLALLVEVLAPSHQIKQARRRLTPPGVAAEFLASFAQYAGT